MREFGLANYLLTHEIWPISQVPEANKKEKRLAAVRAVNAALHGMGAVERPRFIIMEIGTPLDRYIYGRKLIKYLGFKCGNSC